MNKIKNFLQEAKIIKNEKNFFKLQLKDNQKIVTATLTGLLKHQKIDLIVGDNVAIINKNERYLIQKRYLRTNELKRPRISNVENIFLINSFTNPKLDLFFLTKLILWIEIKIKIKPILIFTKKDLINYSNDNLIKEKINWYQKYYEIILTDNKEKKIPFIMTKKINVLMGRSGVGKTTLINRLKPILKLKTTNVSEKSKLGKHQTTKNEFFFINNKLIADTPGFNNINFSDIKKIDLLKNFIFFNKNEQEKCHFQPCYHDHEPKCQIKTKANKNQENNFWWKMWKKILKTVNKD